ncbi:hypothetical protein CVT24_004045 [Panaeolus cyanescens]|uniref:Patatin-like phospholipase domain-containing protein n=1 Tax=Panaeolus cyanescens TaxID=181874 RepID=A0A409Y6A2_9AGAR|nr:hypothetical protein CVT24_004045 [Panaeolus cyanescens]
MPNRIIKEPTKSLQELLAADYVDDSRRCNIYRHIEAFAHALQLDESYFDHHVDPSSPIIPGTPNHARIRKISALSDFAPINLKVKRRKKRSKHDKRNDYLFLLLRWPLLCFIFVFIMAEFSLYVVIRQLVNAKEWISAWRGQKGVLRKKLRSATTYEEWKKAASDLDDFLDFQEWKRIDEDHYYDWVLVRKVKRSLKNFREKSDTFFGTKDLIESYFDELEKSIQFIRDTSELSVDEKKRTLAGISALCLSGGASFGYYHCGVVRAFLDAGLLPRVITGTSAGGLIAALTCTHTDDELRVLLVPELANRITACEEPFSTWIQRVIKTGARFDAVNWAKKCTFFTRGSMTFREAYDRTGRILNISVIPADRHSPTKLLNYITAPDTVIWSALLASAAVPGILNPVVLMQKLKDGSLIPWSWGSRFKDGSLRVDIPLQSLNLYFNVTHPVVSQKFCLTNVKGWRGNFLLSAAEQWLKHELTKNFKVIRDLELLPTLLGQDWSSVFLQRFDGAVTIWPKTRVMDWFRILTDPDPPELERMLQVGKSVTWPKLHMIGNRFRIEKQILLGRQAVHRACKNRPSTSSQEPRNILFKPAGEVNNSDGIKRRGSPSPSSDVPLSVDTDAERSFIRGNRSFRRGRISQNSSPGRDRHISTMRRRTPAELDLSGITHSPEDPPDPPQSASFFQRLRANSFSKLSLSLSYSDKAGTSPALEHHPEAVWSSESSTGDDFGED